MRKVEPKLPRIYLQDGSGDLNIYSGSWWMANQTLAASLEYAGYDFTFERGTDGLNANHSSRVFAQSLEWLWSNWRQPITASRGAAKSERHFVTEILDPAADWEELSAGHGFTEGPAVDSEGNVYFADVRQDRIHKIEHATRKVSLFLDQSGGANGMMFGPDGRLYVCQNKKRQIIAIRPDQSIDVLAKDVGSNDLAVNFRNEVCFTEPA